MKFGIIREGKNPPDKRVVFSPQELLSVKENHPEATFKVQTSPIRVFKDEEYQALGFEVTEDMSDCDILFGVKEVPVNDLIPNKTYFFFSHTIKKQQYNKKLLQTCLERNIRLIDHETLVDKNGHRLIGFGRYAGIVGAYNAFRAFGIKYELFNLKKAEELKSQKDLIERLLKPYLPPIKVVLTGTGKVGNGAKEMLDAMRMKQVSIDQFLNKDFDEPVYVHIDVEDYYRRTDGKKGDFEDFKSHPNEYESDFEKFANAADIFIAGHFYKDGSPKILTKEMLNNPNNTIKVVADISCDIDGPIDSTIRVSTIADPIYGYYPRENKEVDIDHPAAIVVMAVDNLPCELPKDASEGFGEMFINHIIPAFFNNDEDGILERGTICENGKLTKRFDYLSDFVNE
ncbi:alanine dehydrogenase [Flavobacterium sp. xlx-214]|uniref:NAD(P)-dependent oxidoreductase n=1 Tax=unclassified Flavobacterium TaxID=196869 RepID=UPI0013D64257|nr:MULTISPECIES: NAD(P)-dependent oxidoreductase [unclassified Flavobacterium]MBA5791826.1 alanine dehydrogenase [Flavobacterium sp. xlx-221]QMI83063.1 alanine dehydrogenase [Flavobacterium sp. xlx-214]